MKKREIDFFWQKFSIFFQQAALGASLLLPLFFKEFQGYSEPQIGFLMSLGYTACIVAPVIFGYLGSKYAVHLLVGYSYLLFGIGCYCLLFSDGFLSDSILYGVGKIGQSGYFALLPVTFLLLFKDSFATNYAKCRRVGSAGYLFSLVTSGYIIDNFGFVALINFILFYSLLAAFPYLFLVKVERLIYFKGGYFTLFKNKKFILILLGTIFSWVVFSAILFFQQLRLKEMGASSTVISILEAGNGLAAMLSLGFAGRMTEKYGAKPLLFFAPVFMSLRCFLMYFPESNYYWFFLIQALQFCTWTFLDVALLKQLREMLKIELYPRSQALFTSTVFISYAIGSALMGYLIKTYDLQTSFLLISPVALLSLIPFYFATKKETLSLES